MQLNDVETLVYTYEELNNIVYLGLKYSCEGLCDRLSNPSNDDIEEIVVRIGHNQSIENIVNEVLQFAKRVSGMMYHEFGYSKRSDHYIGLINLFNSLPYELRNDLGNDTELINNRTKH